MQEDPLALTTSTLEEPDGAPALRWYHGLPRFPLLIIGVAVIAALLAPWLSPHDPYTPDLVGRLKAPSREHWAGTDALGRDMLTRLMFGARTTLIVVAVALGLGALVGLVVGMLAGFSRGRADSIIARIIDAILAFPPIFFGLLFAVTIGSGLRSVVLAVALVLWARFARVMRGEVVTLRDRDFVAQARINGCSNMRLMAVHLLPNVMATFMVLVTLNMGYVILLEASLSFLGAGIVPPTASWGEMIASGQAYITSAWWVSIVPGIAILLVVLAFNVLGDWLRERLDPKLRNQL